jgi:hypothetical protein
MVLDVSGCIRTTVYPRVRYSRFRLSAGRPTPRRPIPGNALSIQCIWSLTSCLTFGVQSSPTLKSTGEKACLRPRARVSVSGFVGRFAPPIFVGGRFLLVVRFSHATTMQPFPIYWEEEFVGRLPILAKRSAVDLDAEPTTPGRTAHRLMPCSNCCCDHAKYQGLAQGYASIANRQAFQWNTWGPENDEVACQSIGKTLAD